MQSSMPKILLIGSTCVDVIIEIDHLPKTAEDIQPKRQTLALGGCAYNAANIVRQSGVPYMFVTPIGTGVYGDYIRKSFQARKLPIHVNADAEWLLLLSCRRKRRTYIFIGAWCRIYL